LVRERPGSTGSTDRHLEKHMTTTDTYEGWIGRNAVDQNGDKIGVIADIYYDDATDQPEWITVKTGLLGTRSSFVPLHGADSDGENLRLPYEKSQVKDAPNIDTDGSLTPDEERTLYDYYGRGADFDTDRSTSGSDGDADADQTVGHDTSGPTTDDAMTRSEEELQVGTERRETGRARLRKYVVTEQKTVTVPVEREEVRIEREDITDANVGDALDGPDISEEEHEVVLHEEQAVVGKTTVPKERVRLDTETVVDQQEVSDEVRKERIEVEGADERR
jgi:uncharacterized protein (TIGR02271 family)